MQKVNLKKMEDIQLYLAHNYLSFPISSITGAVKATIIICMSLTKETNKAGVSDGCLERRARDGV